MGLRAKILSGFLILTMMLLIAGVWSIHELATIGSSVQGILDDNYRSINAARTMTEALEREDSAVLLLLSGKWEEGRSIIRSADAHFQQAFQVASSNVTVPGEQNYIDSLKATYENYREIWKKPIVGTVREGNLKWYFQEAHQAFMEAKLAVERLMAINDRTMYRTASDLKNRTHRATMPGIVAILAALVFSLMFNYLINYYVVGPIIRITRGIKGYLEGGKSLEVDIETKDELFSLATSIRELMAQTRTSGTNP